MANSGYKSKSVPYQVLFIIDFTDNALPWDE